MSRYRGPRLRVVRRLGVLPGLTRKDPKRAYPPGQHGQGRRKRSEYAIRLEEKQKLRFNYGVTEKQLLRYVKKARRVTGSTGQVLLQLLEMRLDNTVFRLGMAPTIPAARQVVNHGHITVNGVKTNIGSYRLKPGDVVQVREKSRNMALVLEALGSPERDLPEYIEVDPKAMTATFVRMPELSDVPYPVQMDPAQVVEYYSS